MRRGIPLLVYKALLRADAVENINTPWTHSLHSKTFISKTMPAPPVPASLQSSVDATKVEYVQLGSCGLRVSSPILGTMGIGSKDWMNVKWFFSFRFYSIWT